MESRPETEKDYQVLVEWTDIEEAEGGISHQRYQDRMYKPGAANGQFQRWRQVNGEYEYERTFLPNKEYLNKYLPQTATRQNHQKRPGSVHYSTNHATLLNRMRIITTQCDTIHQPPSLRRQQSPAA